MGLQENKVKDLSAGHKIRIYTPNDYPVIKTWWEFRMNDAIPERILPKLGAVAEADNGELLAAAWVYMDNSVGVCWLEWLITNPEAQTFAKKKAVHALVEFLSKETKDLDYGVMIAHILNDRLVSQAEGLGFLRAGPRVQPMLRV